MSDPLDALWFLCEQELGTQERMSAAIDKAKKGGTDLGGGQVKSAGRAGLEIGRKPQQKPDLSGGAKQADSGDYLVAGKPQDKVGKVDTSDPQAMIKRSVDTARQSGVPYPVAVQQTTGSPPPIDTPQAKATIATGMGASSQSNDKPGRDGLQQGRTEAPGPVSVSARIHDMEGEEEVSQQNLQEPGRSETDPDLQGDKIKASGSQPAGEDEPASAGQAVAQKSSDPNKTLDSMVDEPGQQISPEDDLEGAEMELDGEIEDLDKMLGDQWEQYTQDINTRIDEMEKISKLKARRLREKFDTFSKAFNKIPSTQNRSSFLSAIGKAKTYEGRINSGAGKNNLGYLDVQSLNDNQERLLKGYGDGSPEAIEKFVRGVRSTKVDPEFLDSSFELLPDKFKNALSGKGKVGQPKVHFLGYDDDGNAIRGAATSKDRAKLMWQYYLEQGGRDAYTGLPLDLESMDLEHVVAFDNKDNGKPTQEDYENREHEKNHVLINSNINQKKSNLSMKDFLEREMNPFLEMSEEEFGGRQAMYDRANKIGDESQQLITTLIDEISEDGKVTAKELKSDMTMELLRGHFDNSDKTYEDLRKEFRKRAKVPEDKKKADQLKSGLGKELLMSLGMTRGLPDKSGRRTQKMNENVYRGFLLTMAKADPKRRAELRNAWEEAIEVGRGARSEKAFRDKILELNGIDADIISDKKMGRVFREEWEWEDLLDLTEDYDYNDDVDFLRKYGRA